MKLHTALYIPFVVLIVSGCTKKDDPKPVSKLVGTWEVVGTSATMSVNGVGYKDYIMSFGFTEQEANDFIDEVMQASTVTGFYPEVEFKADGTWRGDVPSLSLPQTGKWTLSTDETILTLTSETAPDPETWTVTKATDTDLWMDIAVDPSTIPIQTPVGFQYTATMKCTRKK